MSDTQKIKNRINHHHELEIQLSKAGPAKALSIIRQQTEIEEYYFSDVSDLLDIISQQAEEIERLKERERYLFGSIAVIAHSCGGKISIHNSALDSLPSLSTLELVNHQNYAENTTEITLKRNDPHVNP